MPIFEYACTDCHHQFETLVRSGSTPECPQCHSTTLEKQLSVFATTGVTNKEAPPPMCAPCGAAGGCGNPNGPGACGF